MGRSTRLLVTHQRQFLPSCDRLLVLRGGRPIALGTWAEVSPLNLPELTAGHTGAVTLGGQGGDSGVQDVKAALAAAGDVSVDELLDQREAAAAGERQQEEEEQESRGRESGNPAGPTPFKGCTQPQVVLPAMHEEGEEGEEVEDLQNTAARPAGICVEAEAPVAPAHPGAVAVALEGEEAPGTPGSSSAAQVAIITSPRKGGPQPRLTRIVSGAWLGQLSSRRWLPAALNLGSGPSMSYKSRSQLTGLEGAWRQDSTTAVAPGPPAAPGGGKPRLTWALSGSRSFFVRTLTFKQPGAPGAQGSQAAKDAGGEVPPVDMGPQPLPQHCVFITICALIHSSCCLLQRRGS
jgi:hypothetical protein